jgi:hypothetical protein
MLASSSIVLPSSRSFILGSSLVVLLALFAQELRSEDCVPGWETYPVFQTNAVYAVFEYDGIVYRGGWFSLFRWIDGDWEIMDIGGDIGTLFVGEFRTFGENLVIGGYFPTAWGMTVNSIATWDGNEFGTLGSGVDGEIHSLVVYNGDLIAGGGFDHAGGVEAQNIARWDGGAWYPLGTGVSGPAAFVQDMVVWRGDLYVVGDFTHAGDSEVSYVARWDGSTWSDVGGGVSMIGGGPTGLRGVDVYDGDLVIVGALDFAGGVEAINIASWNGETWSPLGSGSDPYDDMWGWRQAAQSVASYKGLLHVGADFSEAVGDAAAVLAVWDGVSWEPVDGGLDGEQWPIGPYIRDLEVAGEGITSSLLMGGNFNEANGEETDNVARYTNCHDTTGIPHGDVPGAVAALINYPNPFNPQTTIVYEMVRTDAARLQIFDMGGRLVTTLVAAVVPAGSHSVTWNGRDTDGRDVPSGVYVLRLEAGGQVAHGRMTLVR